MGINRALFHERTPLGLDWDITCTILVPFGLFFYQVGSEFLRKFFRWLLAAQMLFAVFGISAAVLGASLARLGIVNDIVVLTTCVGVALLLLAERWRPGGPRPGP